MATALVSIAATSFIMGSESGADDERPMHRVSLDAFLIGACQVTNADYAIFLASSAHSAPPFWGRPHFDDPRQPVVGVSWLDAVAYCAWLGGAFRLPTEAEWECAARGGVEGARFPWGDAPPQSRLGYQQRWLNGPEPVAQGPANGYGLHDICENVHEWCGDWYSAGYYATSPQHNPRGPESGTRRASRGGSWRHAVKISRCAARSSLPPHSQYADYGFRIACDASS